MYLRYKHEEAGKTRITEDQWPVRRKLSFSVAFVAAEACSFAPCPSHASALCPSMLAQIGVFLSDRALKDHRFVLDEGALASACVALVKGGRIY